MANCTFTVTIAYYFYADDSVGSVLVPGAIYNTATVYDFTQAGQFQSLIAGLLSDSAGVTSFSDWSVTETIGGGINYQTGTFSFVADESFDFSFLVMMYGESTFGWTAQAVSSCDAVTTACPDCLEKNFAACAASYDITTGLTAATEYTVVLTDVNEIRYTQLITTDGSGNLTIDTTDFPPGAFTPEFGGFTMEVYSDVELTTPVDITVGSLTYGCVKLRFQHTVTTTSYIPPVFSFLVTDQLDYIVTETGDTFICN